MGIRDRLRAIKNAAISPLSVWLAGEGSPLLAQAGDRVTVVVKVSGEDDGTIDVIELRLKGDLFNRPSDPIVVPLGEVPKEIGHQRVEVELPADLIASWHKAIAWKFEAEVKRTKGMGADAASPVDIAGTAAGVWWPPGERAVSEGGAAEIRVEAPELAQVGATVAGTVTVTAREEINGVPLDVGVAFEHHGDGDAKLTRAPLTRLATDLRLAPGETASFEYELALAEGSPPSLDTGFQSVAWQVRASLPGAEGWRWFGLLDPEATAGSRERPGQSLVGWLADVTNVAR